MGEQKWNGGPRLGDLGRVSESWRCGRASSYGRFPLADEVWKGMSSKRNHVSQVQGCGVNNE